MNNTGYPKMYCEICKGFTEYLPCLLLKEGGYSGTYRCINCWRNGIMTYKAVIGIKPVPKIEDVLYNWEDYETR